MRHFGELDYRIVGIEVLTMRLLLEAVLDLKEVGLTLNFQQVK